MRARFILAPPRHWAPLLNLQLRVIETTTIEQKLAELERLSGEAGSKGDRVQDLKIGKGSEAYGFPVVPDSSK